MKIASLYGGCTEPGCMAGSYTNSLPTPTDLTENHYLHTEGGGCFGVSRKSVTVVLCAIAIESVPPWPIFEKYSHLRDTRGVLALGFRCSENAYPYSRLFFIKTKKYRPKHGKRPCKRLLVGTTTVIDLQL